MMADPRSQSLVKNFAGQWLFLRNIPAVQPDPAAFPTWDENLRLAMQKETELWLDSQMRDDRSVVDLLTTDYTFVNQRLAEHYGMKGIWGNDFRRVAVEDPRRRGLLGQASIMAVTSYPNRTAPTVRGKWVLEQLLGTPPPPPPPERSVPEGRRRPREVDHAPAHGGAQNRSRSAPSATRSWTRSGSRSRTSTGSASGAISDGDEGTEPIDPSGVLPDGSAFDGPAGLRDVLVKRQDMFVETFVERLLTYAHRSRRRSSMTAPSSARSRAMPIRTTSGQPSFSISSSPSHSR